MDRRSIGVTCAATMWTVWGCAGGEGQQRGVAVTDSANIEIVMNASRLAGLPEWSIGEPMVTVGEVDGAAEVLFSRIQGGALLADGGFAVADGGSGQIRTFGPAGEFRASMGGAGEGPSEFGNLWGVWVSTNGDLIGRDRARRRFVVFTPQGELRLERSHDGVTPHINAQVMVLGERVAMTDEHPRQRGGVGEFFPIALDVIALALDGGQADTLMTLSNGVSGVNVVDGIIIGSTGALWDAKVTADAAAGRLYVGTGAHPEVHVHDAAGALRRIIRWQGPTRAVTPDIVREDLERAIAANPTGETTLRTIYDALPVADSIPYYGSVIASEDGSVWLGAYRTNVDPRPASYTVFDPTGAAVGRIEVPGTIEILDLGSGVALVVIEDDLGVERVSIVRVGPTPIAD